MPQAPFVEQESEPLSQKTVQAPQIASVTALKTEQAPQKIARRSQNTDLPPLKTDQIGLKVFLHTSDERDRSVLEEIGDALRVEGYTIPGNAPFVEQNPRRRQVLLFSGPTRRGKSKIDC
jgi:hypothetical protein